MKSPQPQIVRRPAFTLIELLVVIAIIAVLASMLLAAIFKAMSTARVVQTRSDISQLESSIANFTNVFQVDYLPSNTNSNDPFLTRLYPQSAGLNPNPWAGMGAIQGNQCLVFFLGGVNYQGFSPDPTSPLAGFNSGEVRRGPFFTFPANRINANNLFCDVYGTPYAYFSAYSQTGAPNGYVASDNQNLAAWGVPGPYTDVIGGSWLKPDTCQIISAGVNMQFGPGGTWPGVPGNSPGFDDISNFATGQLGAGQ